MSKRVVITGLGVVSPVGNDTKSFWNGLISGKNGIDKITRFDTFDFKATLAAEVKGFDPTIYMEKQRSENLTDFLSLRSPLPHRRLMTVK